MVQYLQIEPPRLHMDDTGTIRVGNSRITFDVVISDHLRGDTPEQILDGRDALSLGDVYAAIAYYHAHRAEADEYLRRRDEEAAAIRAKIEANRPRPLLTREELLDRWRKMKGDPNASLPQ